MINNDPSKVKMLINSKKITTAFNKSTVIITLCYLLSEMKLFLLQAIR